MANIHRTAAHDERGPVEPDAQQHASPSETRSAAPARPATSIPARIMTRSQRIAEQAGFAFPTHVLGLPYTPAEPPEFARFGTFALYLSACIAEADQRDIHRGTVSSRYADPIAARVMLLTDALEDVGNRHIGLELNLTRFLSDVIYASRRDPDQARRLAFAVALYTDVANQFDRLRLFARARDYRKRAELLADAMRDQPAAAAE
jgi:hypothetical protein